MEGDPLHSAKARTKGKFNGPSGTTLLEAQEKMVEASLAKKDSQDEGSLAGNSWVPGKGTLRHINPALTSTRGPKT